MFVELAGDWRVFSFTAVLAGLTCLLFGLLPGDPRDRNRRRRGHEGRRARDRRTPASASACGAGWSLLQVALSLVLVVGALLFVRTLRNLITLDAGFAQAICVIAVRQLHAARRDSDAGPPGRVHADLLERLRASAGRGRRRGQAFESCRSSGSGSNDCDRHRRTAAARRRSSTSTA